MRRVVGLAVLSLALWGCPGDDGGDDGATTATTGSASSTGSGGVSSSGGEGTGSSGGGSSSGSAEGTSTGMADSSSGGGPACEPPVVGEWNACLDEMGGVDNTLCNWVGNPDGTGFLTCLSSSEIEGGNICTISGCEDTCDCFDPPATGTAEVVCAPILEGGENACGLDCSRGQTCPDGMQCGGGLCFWPPA